jgi:hypothetical protein
MSGSHEWGAEDRLERDAWRAVEWVTGGGASLHGMTPAEAVMEAEEAEERAEEVERQRVRQEVFAGLLGYLFAEGPDPALLRERIEGFYVAVVPQLLPRIHGPREWVGRAAVVEVLRRRMGAADVGEGRGALATWWRQLEGMEDGQTVARTLALMGGLLLSEGTTWRLVTSTALCLAKALRPQLVGGMSLEDIAVLSGDGGGRATPCDRIQRLYNERVAAAGARACRVHFQKTAGVVEKYREAQAGNANRRRKRRRRG